MNRSEPSWRTSCLVLLFSLQLALPWHSEDNGHIRYLRALAVFPPVRVYNSKVYQGSFWCLLGYICSLAKHPPTPDPVIHSMAPGRRSTANTDHLQAWKTKFANMDIICNIIGRCHACKKVFIPSTSFWSPQISGHGNNSNAIQLHLTDWWACSDMEVVPEPTKWMFIFWSTIVGTNPEIVHKEVHKTPKRKESKSSRKKPHPPFPHITQEQFTTQLN